MNDSSYAKMLLSLSIKTARLPIVSRFLDHPLYIPSNTLLLRFPFWLIVHLESVILDRTRGSNNKISSGTCKLLSMLLSTNQLARQQPPLFMRCACPAYVCHFTCEACFFRSRVHRQRNVSQEGAHLAACKGTVLPPYT